MKAHRSIVEDFKDQSRKFLKTYLPDQRWFRSKSRNIIQVNIDDYSMNESKPYLWILLILGVEFDQGSDEVYFLPLVLKPSEGNSEVPLFKFHSDQRTYFVEDAFSNLEFNWWWMHQMFRDEKLETSKGMIEITVKAKNQNEPGVGHSIELLDAEQSNTSLLLDHQWILKIYRRLDPGINPEIEALEFLNRHHFANAPLLYSFIMYKSETLPLATVGVMQQYLVNEGDGWNYFQKTLTATGQDPTLALKKMIEDIRELGRVTAKLHGVLASDSEDSVMAPEVITPQDIQNWKHRFKIQTEETWELLWQTLTSERLKFPEVCRQLLDHKEPILQTSEAYDLFYDTPLLKIRCHHDLHLGQVLKQKEGWIFFDFEGEPMSGTSERKAKVPCFKDLAGMIRSFHYALSVSMKNFSPSLEKFSELFGWMKDAFKEGYFHETVLSIPSYLFPTREKNERAIRLFEIEKAIYEIRYELNNRPEWMEIPARGLLSLISEERLDAH